ncbi:MAG: HAD family hydrolase [Bdellovibrionaceae bacterium]|nr:HAD family hydrolase [Bdellovibrio sp.]
MKISTVLLDIDGTLVDSNDAHAKSWVEAISEFKFDINYQIIREKIGMGGDKLLPLVIGIESASEVGKKISKLRQSIFQTKYLPNLLAFDGTRELLEHMIKVGLQLVVATSASKDDLSKILEQAKISKLLSNRVTSDDAENSKPAPDILSAALKKMKVCPEEAIMIGDTPYDIEAARLAKVRSIGFTCGGWPAEALAGSFATYGGPKDLLKHFDESFFSSAAETGAKI